VVDAGPVIAIVAKHVPARALGDDPSWAAAIAQLQPPSPDRGDCSVANSIVSGRTRQRAKAIAPRLGRSFTTAETYHRRLLLHGWSGHADAATGPRLERQSGRGRRAAAARPSRERPARCRALALPQGATLSREASPF
jgi:hypothetical protein